VGGVASCGPVWPPVAPCGMTLMKNLPCGPSGALFGPNDPPWPLTVDLGGPGAGGGWWQAHVTV